MTKVHTDFIALINARKKNIESFKSFETRLDALHAKFKSHGDDMAFSRPLLALQLLNAAHVEDNLRVSILAAYVNNIQAE